jgi:hypothetical protein
VSRSRRREPRYGPHSHEHGTLRSLARRASSSIATRVTRKSFTRRKKILHCKETTVWQRERLDVVSSQRATFSTQRIVEERLEVPLGNADVVAGENRNGRIERIDFFSAGAGPAQIDLVLVGAVGKSAGAGDSIHHG